ncbi:MAG: solute carrier family 23 protein [Eubacteriales bacterium]|nr:solute carrier family 23 protein [Eubacteriales bacterium]
MNLIYDVKDKPKFSQILIFALQQMLAIMAATLVVPVLVNSYGAVNLNMDIAAALLGAGVGTAVYLAFTKMESPVFLGSSFAFLSAMYAATAFGYFGIITGAIMAGFVYVLIAIAIKFFGTKWVDKLMPPIIIGILAGYLVAGIFTIIGNATNCEYLQVLNVSALTSLDFGSISGWLHVPKFAFIEAAKESFDWANLGAIALLYMPVAFVVFAEHIADHKNLSSIIGKDLVGDKPGLTRTLLGDGVGSMAGAFFGSCPNTTYGESIGCVAITRNASVVTILAAAIGCVVLSFFAPFVAFVNTIPSCVMGGVCITLYGFIAVSGLRMFKHINLDENRNLFVVATILITGIGGLALNFGRVTITNIATALILGIIVNLVLSIGEKKKADQPEEK